MLALQPSLPLPPPPLRLAPQRPSPGWEDRDARRRRGRPNADRNSPRAPATPSFPGHPAPAAAPAGSSPPATQQTRPGPSAISIDVSAYSALFPAGPRLHDGIDPLEVIAACDEADLALLHSVLLLTAATLLLALLVHLMA
jgi:hypothetical protein